MTDTTSLSDDEISRFVPDLLIFSWLMSGHIKKFDIGDVIYMSILQVICCLAHARKHTLVLVEPTTSEIQKKFVYLPYSFNCANTVDNYVEISPASPAHSSIIGRVSNDYTEQAKVSFLLPKTRRVSINGKCKMKINLTETQSNRKCS